MPAVSLLIPIYNVEKYLRQCLDSAKDQTLSDIEIICINDGSTDGSRSIIQEYLDADPRFRVIDKPNSGYGVSMNMGLDAATGDYIGILESDDIFELDGLEKLYNIACKFDAQAVKGDFYLYWSKPEVRRELYHVIDEDMADKLVNPEDDPRILYRKASIWSAIYRRDFLEKNSIRFLETPGASYQDCGFNFKVWVMADRVAFTTSPILNYRQDNEKSSVNSPGKVYCVCDEHDEIDRYLTQHPNKRKRFKGIQERVKYDNYMWSYDRLASDLRSEFLQRASKEFAHDIEVGDVDMDLFEEWAKADLGLLVNNPRKFDEFRDKYAKPGKVNTFKRYYNIGGMKLVGKMLKDKVRRQ